MHRGCEPPVVAPALDSDTYTSLWVKDWEPVGDCPLGVGLQLTGASSPAETFNGVYEQLSDSVYRHVVYPNNIVAWHGNRWGWVVGHGDASYPYGEYTDTSSPHINITMTSEVVSITPLSPENDQFAIPLTSPSSDTVHTISSGTTLYDYTKFDTINNELKSINQSRFQTPIIDIINEYLNVFCIFFFSYQVDESG